MTKMEYKWETSKAADFDDTLARNAERGWELVTVCPYADLYFLFVWKRPK